jgi:broad specificity phosphatase PhoE
MAVDIVYETHATTTDNEAGFATGWLAGTLSVAGRDQARDLGMRRRDDGISVVLVSDLARTVETAAIAFDRSDIPVVEDVRLRECDYGDWNGQPVARLQAEKAHRIDAPFPGGQSYRDVVAQTGDLLLDLAATCDGQRVLVIAHTANRYALDFLLLGRPLLDSVTAPFDWQPGWTYRLPTGWRV